MAQVTFFKLTKPYKPEKPMSMPALVFLKLTKRLPGGRQAPVENGPLHHHFEPPGTKGCPSGWSWPPSGGCSFSAAFSLLDCFYSP